MGILNKMGKFFRKAAVYEGRFIFPFSPKDATICDRRRNFLKEFTISPDYHVSILSYINENFDLKGKRVLDLGGSNIPREIMLDDFNVKQFVGIDYIDSWWPDPNHKREKICLLKDAEAVFSADDPYTLFSGNAVDVPESLFAEHFDVIVSFSSLEHFGSMPLVLEKAYKILKKGGLFFASSEPLWSSGKGHHFWISPDYNFQATSDFDYAHLLYDKNQFRRKFENSRELDKVIQQIYDWNGINRLFYSEIESAVRESHFTFKEMQPFIIQSPPRDIEAALYEKYSLKAKSEKEFSIRGIQWVLQK